MSKQHTHTPHPEIVKRLKGTSEKVKRAQILLKADADGPRWPDEKIAEAYDCSVRTVENLRERLVTAGFDTALERKKRAMPPTPHKLDGVGEAKAKYCELTDVGEVEIIPLSLALNENALI